MRGKLLVLIMSIILATLSISPALGQSDVAFVRLAHYVSDAPALDVFLNGEVSEIRSVLFRQPSDWVAIAPGTYEVAITTTGGDLEDILYPAKSVDLAAGTWTTIFTAGAALRSEVSVSIVTEDYSTIPDGQARVTIFHGILGAVPVNFFAAGSVMVNQLAFPGAAGSNDGATTLDLPAGNYSDLQIIRADRGVPIIEIPATDFAAGMYYLVAAWGLPETKIGADIVPTDPAAVIAAQAEAVEATVPEKAFVRAANFVPAGSAVDLYIDGAVSTVTGLASGSASDFVEVTPGDHEIVLVPTGKSTAEAIFTGSANIPAGSFASVYATRASNAAANVNLIVEDYSKIPAGKARVTVLHAADGANPVNVWLGEDVLLLQSLAYPGAIGDNDGSATVDVAAGAHDIFISLSRADNALVEMTGTTFEEGMYYFLAVVMGDGGLSTLVVPTDVSALLGSGE